MKYRGHTYSRFRSYSEANASELLENLGKDVFSLLIIDRVSLSSKSIMISANLLGITANKTSGARIKYIIACS